MDHLRQILTWVNAERAIRKVVSNKGSAGVDGMQVSELLDYFRANWQDIKSSIENGTYNPQAVLGKEIDKANGGKRLLGIPTVVDRTVQQMISQVLAPLYKVGFSCSSYGFIAGRNAHQAVHRALDYVNDGYSYVVDLDLKDFFNVVNHDLLMGLLYRNVKNKGLLRLIRKYLKSGMMIGGVMRERGEGTPQGSPLSPLLSNILLDGLDKELERRGLRFVRYADDCSIFVRSKKAAERVLGNITGFIETQLRLKVNHDKTQACHALHSSLLGYGFVGRYEKGSRGVYRLRVCPKAFKRMKQKVKEITRKTRPLSFKERIAELNRFMKGWLNYFKYAHTVGKFKKLDSWIRRRLRYCIWHHWKRPDKKRRSLIRLGVEQGQAYAWSRTRMGGWRVAGSPILRTTLTLKRLGQGGYISFKDHFLKISCVQ